MKKILNLSNHRLTEEQLKELSDKKYEIVELTDEEKKQWGQLTPKNYKEICDTILHKYWNKVDSFHLAGFPPAVTYFYCLTLIQDRYITKYCYYAYSTRETIEKEINGEIVKTSVFRHQGFYEY